MERLSKVIFFREVNNNFSVIKIILFNSIINNVVIFFKYRHRILRKFLVALYETEDIENEYKNLWKVNILENFVIYIVILLLFLL